MPNTTFLGQTSEWSQTVLFKMTVASYFIQKYQSIFLTSQSRGARMFKYLMFYQAVMLIFHWFQRGFLRLCSWISVLKVNI